MKKIFLLMVIAIIVLPSTLFAVTPTELEVQETTAAVLSAFGLVFLSSMFGESPEGVEVDMDMASGNSSMVFENFDAASFMETLGDMTGSETSDEEMPEFLFSSMSGTISVDQEGEMSCDVTLKGGNIQSLQLKTAGEELEYLKANGRDYSYLDNIMGEE